MPNNVIDLGKFKTYYDQLADIQKVVDKLVTKQNADVYNKIGTKTEILFNSISRIDVKSAPVEDIRVLINLLKNLRETCVTLSAYRAYLVSIIPQTIDTLESQVSQDMSAPVQSDNVLEMPMPKEGQVVDKNKTLELINNEGNVA